MSDLVGNPEDRFSRIASHMTENIESWFTPILVEKLRGTSFHNMTCMFVVCIVAVR